MNALPVTAPKNCAALYSAGFGNAIRPTAPLGSAISPMSGIDPERLGKIPNRWTPNGWVGMADWPKQPHRVSQHVIDKWDSWGAGAGIITRDFPTIDADILDAEAAALVKVVVLQRFGDVLQRVGRAPKAAYIGRRAGTPFGKRVLKFRLKDGTEHMIEVLGDGQYVNIATIHPATGLPYALTPPIKDVKANALSEISEASVDAFLSDVGDQLVTVLGATIVSLVSRARPDLMTKSAGDATVMSHAVVKAFARVGALRVDKPNPSGWVAVTCCWRAAHTDGDDAAGVMIHSDGGWAYSCFHSHCSERKANDVWQWFDAQGVTIPSPDGVSVPDNYREALATLGVPPGPSTFREDPLRACHTRDSVRREEQKRIAQEIGDRAQNGLPLPEIATLAEMEARMVFLEEGTRVVDRLNPKVAINFQEFVAKTAASKTPIVDGDRTKHVPTAKLWLGSRHRLSVVSTAFDPAMGEFCSNSTGAMCINVWAPFKRAAASIEDAGPFIEHIHWLFGDQADTFLNWLAHIEQQPGQLPHVHWLHIATNTGLGRNWVICVLARVWEGRVATNFDLVAMLNDGFSGRLSGKLLAQVDEIREGGGDAWKHAEKLKSEVTREYREINPKYGRRFEERNVVRWLLFSNHRSALPLEDNDRRWNVVVTDAPPHPQSYYTRLYDLCDEPDFIAAVAYYLRSRDISGFRAGERPIDSASRREVIAASRSDLQENLSDWSAAWPHDLATASQIRDGAELLPEEAKRMGRAYRHALEGADWVLLSPDMLYNHRKEKIYCRRGKIALWKGKTTTQRREGLPPEPPNTIQHSLDAHKTPKPHRAAVLE